MAKRRKGSLSSVFRTYLEAHPDGLNADNVAILEQFAKDYPKRAITSKVKQVLYNVKARLKKGKPGVEHRRQTKAAASAVVVTAARTGKRSAPLTTLEEQIDDCMIFAKRIGQERLERAIGLLRQARNAVIVMVEE